MAAHQRGRPPGSPLQALAEACGRLPLALRVAGSYLISYANWSLPDYLALLEQSRRKYLATLDDPASQTVGRRGPRLSAWTGCARRNAAWQPPGTRWPCSLRRSTGPRSRPVWDVTEAQAEDDLSALVQQSLVEYDPATQTYSLHDLLAELAREMAVTEEVALPPCGLLPGARAGDQRAVPARRAGRAGRITGSSIPSGRTCWRTGARWRSGRMNAHCGG